MVAASNAAKTTTKASVVLSTVSPACSTSRSRAAAALLRAFSHSPTRVELRSESESNVLYNIAIMTNPSCLFFLGHEDINQHKYLTKIDPVLLVIITHPATNLYSIKHL